MPQYSALDDALVADEKLPLSRKFDGGLRGSSERLPLICIWIVLSLSIGFILGLGSALLLQDSESQGATDSVWSMSPKHTSSMLLTFVRG